MLLTGTVSCSSSGGNTPRRILIDGGRSTSYQRNTRDFLGGLRAGNAKIDIICVSHIDDDHITGVLQLVEDEVAWRAFEFQQEDDPDQPPPTVARPPEIGEVWHNGLFHLVGDQIAPSVEGVLESVATVLAGAPSEELKELASELDALATGEQASMELSRRLSPEQLGIALNPHGDGPLMKRGTSDTARGGDTVTLGPLKISVLGPSDDDIEKLRLGWQKWLDQNKKALRELQAEMLEDEERLGTLSPRIVANPMLETALGEGLKGVTPANLASLMLLVEEGTATVLLTGDGVSQEILDGLAHHGKLDENQRIHVNVLKVQHHGAKANVEAKFVKARDRGSLRVLRERGASQPRERSRGGVCQGTPGGDRRQRAGRSANPVQVLVHQQLGDARPHRSPQTAHEGDRRHRGRAAPGPHRTNAGVDLPQGRKLRDRRDLNPRSADPSPRSRPAAVLTYLFQRCDKHKRSC